jgi:hypothetical protein
MIGTMSFGQPIRNEKSMDDQEKDNPHNLIDPMSNSAEEDNRGKVFDSEDFKSFLNTQKLMVSKDSCNNTTTGGFSVFKSRDSFVSGFLSKEWETKPSGSPRSRTSSLTFGSDYTSLKGPNANTIKTNADVASIASLKDDDQPAVMKNQDSIARLKDEKLEASMKSRDWIACNTLGTHVEIPYSIGMFSSNRKTSAIVHSSMEQTESSLPSSMRSRTIRTDFSSPPMNSVSVENPTLKSEITQKKKKRNRKPRTKIIPKHKKYVEPTDNDVLQGRGGRSNHHPGNNRYRDEVERRQDWYKKTEDKDEKTSISEALVLYVQSYGGNFLEKDDNGWYVIDDVVARRKTSQALREDKDPEKRKAKRQRFLEKRARVEEERRKEEENM